MFSSLLAWGIASCGGDDLSYDNGEFLLSEFVDIEVLEECEEGFEGMFCIHEQRELLDDPPEETMGKRVSTFLKECENKSGYRTGIGHHPGCADSGTALLCCEMLIDDNPTED